MSLVTMLAKRYRLWFHRRATTNGPQIIDPAFIAQAQEGADALDRGEYTRYRHLADLREHTGGGPDLRV